MRFLAVYSHIERDTPPTQEEMDAMGKLIEEMMKEGTLISTEGCLPSALGARVRRSGSKITVTDGPFAETKELIGGVPDLRAKTKERRIGLPKAVVVVARAGG